MPRAMWAGIAAMSTILPFMEDMHYRVRKRIVGNIAGVICFTVLYFLLPSSIYAYIGILGGIGVGFSAQYGWQAVFNTFGALAIAAETYGLQGAVSLRVIQNVFGVVFALAFCVIFCNCSEPLRVRSQLLCKTENRKIFFCSDLLLLCG